MVVLINTQSTREAPPSSGGSQFPELCGLNQTYAYYQRTERMLSRGLADLPDLPVMQRILEPYFAYWEQVRDGLAEGWGIQGRSHEKLRAVLTHLLDFRTWYAFIRLYGSSTLPMMNSSRSQSSSCAVSPVSDVVSLH
jgi:hypothetical protein